MKISSCLSILFAPLLAASISAQPSPPPPPNAPPALTAKDIARYQAQTRILNDWANLSRYRDDNARLSPPAPGENRVVFMGDSITDAWIGVDPGFFRNRPYIDRGISGQTTPQMLIRFRPDVINLKPRVVVILAGTNDIAGNTGPETPEFIEGNLASMAELARANGIRVVLASVLPVFDYPWKPGMQPAPKIVALNDWIKGYAASHHIKYLDYYSATADDRGGMKPGISSDGVHPNQAGYAIMGPLADRAITRALRH